MSSLSTGDQKKIYIYIPQALDTSLSKLSPPTSLPELVGLAFHSAS